MEAIKKVISGERAWNPNEFPDLLIHLKGVAKSLLSSYLKSVEGTKTIPAEISVRKADEQFTVSILDDTNGGHEADTHLIASEQAELLEQSLHDDLEAKSVLLEMLEFKKPREIAENLNLSPIAVNNAIRRIRRKATSIF
jgi:DNA-directed RNA polymerase specialized sigma24 family protein